MEIENIFILVQQHTQFSFVLVLSSFRRCLVLRWLKRLRYVVAAVFK